VVAAGTPDHNKCPLPLAFASFEPHHDQGDRRADNSLPRHHHGARHIESQTRRHPQRYETEPSRNTPNIINQAPMGGVGDVAGPCRLPDMGGVKRPGRLSNRGYGWVG